MFMFSIEEYYKILQSAQAGYAAIKEIGTDYQIEQARKALLLLNEHWPEYTKPLQSFADQCTANGCD